MKERSKYHVADILNLIVFYCVFLSFVVAAVFGIVEFINGTLVMSQAIFRVLFIPLICLPYVLKKIFKVTFSKFASITFYLFMFLSAFLGTCVGLYSTVPAWDVFIHFLMGCLLAVYSIYVLNYTIYKKDKSRHNLFFTFLFMLLFAMAICAMWEIYEFAGDVIFGLNSQRYATVDGVKLIGQEALLDTMIDICIGFAGAIVGMIFVAIMRKVNKRFLKGFTITKLKHKEEVENIEE